MSSKTVVRIAHLYPRSMNTYGDLGNILTLKRRLQWRGFEALVHGVEIGEPIPDGIDLYFFGGGQDAVQKTISHDLAELKGERLREDISAGVPMLAICGGYQLLGREYRPLQGEPVRGLDIFPVTTEATTRRMVGNLLIELDSQIAGSSDRTAVGFENHSGATSFIKQDTARPLGRVISGFGNNGSDGTEGCVFNAAVGCYLHGPLLPKNPHIADWLLAHALRKHHPNTALVPLEDDQEWAAHRNQATKLRKV